MPLKLNLGCGSNLRPAAEGWVNVDRYGEPDLVLDLETETWPWADDSADEVLFNHSLEHMGANPDAFIRVMKQTYRVCRNGARLQIVVPNPRHDNFIDDPTHVRPVTPRTMEMFSKKTCLFWKEIRASNTPLALYHDIDFEYVQTTQYLDPRFDAAHQAGKLDLLAFPHAIKEFDMVFRVVKSAD
jgi:SAM-dependent methyltransferase